jgi:hypothetical protein
MMSSPHLLLLILLLVLGQVAQALHQVDHVTDHNASGCQLCLHVQTAHPHSPQQPASPLFLKLPEGVPAVSTTIAELAASHEWLARAPPVLR